MCALTTWQLSYSEVPVTACTEDSLGMLYIVYEVVYNKHTNKDACIKVVDILALISSDL